MATAIFTSAGDWEKSLDAAKAARGKALKNCAIARRDIKLAKAAHTAEIEAGGSRWAIASLNGDILAAEARLELARREVRHESMWVDYSQDMLAIAIERETA